jgi:hypothetical protein
MIMKKQQKEDLLAIIGSLHNSNNDAKTEQYNYKTQNRVPTVFGKLNSRTFPGHSRTKMQLFHDLFLVASN